MSVFIDETNLFPNIDFFKDKPNYQTRDEIETKISKVLPYKHTVSVEGSDIKVEVFHSDVTDEQLAKIETVINDTFTLCQKYKIVPGDTDVNFRMFLLEDREQYVNIRNSLYYGNVSDDSAGVTILTKGTDALSDVLMYRESDDKFPFESDSFDKIDYHTLSHEFVHCMQNMAKHKDASLSKFVTEGSAEGISCELLDKDGQNTYCQQRIMDGIKAAFANNITPSLIHDFKSIHHLLINEDDNYSVGLVMFNFLQDKHPNIIGKIYEYYSTGDITKQNSISKKTPCIDSEFRYWMLDTISEKARSQDKINSDLAKEMLGDIERHPCTQNPEFRNIVDKFSKMYKGTHETLDWVGQTIEQIDFI